MPGDQGLSRHGTAFKMQQQNITYCDDNEGSESKVFIKKYSPLHKQAAKVIYFPIRKYDYARAFVYSKASVTLLPFQSAISTSDNL